MNKRFFFVMMLFLLLFTSACSSADKGKSTDPKTKPATAQKAEKEPKEKSLEETDTSKKENMAEDLPPLPKSFEESTEYPIVGQFSGGETYQKDFAGYDEIKNVLNDIPTVDENSPEEDIEKVKLQIFSLFKEDLKKVNVPIEQWKSMSLDDPNAENQEVRLKENYNVAILLDASGSMANLENGKTRMDLAKQAIEEFVKSLPKQANISLQVYGHIGSGSDSDKAKSCAAIEEVYPLGQYDSSTFSAALHKFKPAGWTPMAKAIEQTEKDFAQYDGKENTNIIYIVSDGVETCDGNPVQAIKSLNESNIDPVVNIIGYQVDNKGLAQLKEMAQASDGRYINARNHEDLAAEFKQTVDMSKVWQEWQYESRDVINNLDETIKKQLNDWHDGENEKLNREHDNLQNANKYLNEQGILSTSVYLQYGDEFRKYYLTSMDEAREQYLELHEINRDSYFKKFDEVEERYKKARNE
ncbi:MAG TPA: VWA domain-containing protein [Bacillaceae bacterium]